ncbi:MAG TPA: hypothetical protein VGG12_01285 [Methylovirgula sp.]|jgi:hypothetical protein
MTENANNFAKGTSAHSHVSTALQARAEAIVNPASGLANDYLNLFNEIVMLIEQLPTMPELIDDILRWRPVSYQSYFANSVLPGRASALEAYGALDAGFRRNFEAVVADLDRRAVGAVATIRKLYKSNCVTSAATSEVCQRASQNLHEILVKATELVNHGTRVSQETEQERADRLLYTNIRKVG